MKRVAPILVSLLTLSAHAQQITVTAVLLPVM